MSNYAYTPDQTRAITYLHGNVRVIAGAGSGKTKVLVKRYLYILGDNYADDPLHAEHIVNSSGYAQGQVKAQEILAITFTEKAGKEMSERIYARLSTLVATADDKDYWQKCTADLAGAHVGTMHSLYSKIIRENPIEANIDTDFTILNSLNEEYARKTFSSAYISALLKSKDESFALVYDNYSLRQLEELMAFVIYNCAHLPVPKEEFAQMFAGNLENHNQLDTAQKAFRMELINTFSADNLAELHKKSTKTNAALLELYAQQDLHTETTESEYTALLASHSELLKAVFTTVRANSKIGSELKKAYQNLQAAQLAAEIVKTAKFILPALTEFLFAYLTAWRKHKQDNNFLTFDDTEQLCLSLLKNYPAILDKYQRKYKHVLIDEVQDLSEAQHEIIELLTARNDTILFSVGDKKQSIYGFRGSSINTDTKAEEHIALDINFRSQAGIINACNDFFNNYTVNNLNNVHFEGLQAHRTTTEANVFTAFFAKEDGSELEQISKYILYLQQHKQVALDDIAILVRNNSQTELICRYLEKYHISYRVSGRGGFFQDRYVLDLLNLLVCVNNKYAQIELIAVLRSPFFAISDQSITNLYTCRENLWEALADVECRQTSSQAELLTRAYEIISDLSTKSSYLPLVQLLKEIIYNHNWQNIALTQGDALQNLANLNKFYDLVDDFEQTHSPYLAEFIEYITVLRQELGKEEMPNVTDSRQLGVNIMSIHKSKGLEFSYVFLPQLQKISIAGKGGAKICQFDSTNLQVGLRFPIDSSDKYEASFLYNSIREENRQLDEYESLRVLYVAMTRARDVLILSGTRTSSKETTLNNALEWLINYAPPECQTLDFSILDNITTQVQDNVEKLDEQAYQSVMHNCAGICQMQQNYLERLTASAIHDYQLCPTMFKYKHVLKLPDLNEQYSSDPATQSENSTLIGTLVHALLEGEHISEQHQLLADLTASERTRVLTKAQKLFNSYINSTIYHSVRAYINQKEYPFALFSKESQLMLSGIVDCVLVMPDDTLGIVDYKTGQQVDEYLEFYKLQLSLYAGVLQELLRKPVSYLAIHHISDQVRELKLTMAEYSKYQQQLSELIQKISSQTVQDDFPANTQHCSLCSYTYLCTEKNAL